MLGDLGEPAHGDLARQAREVVAADIACVSAALATARSRPVRTGTG
jgi:hypothetical protein